MRYITATLVKRATWDGLVEIEDDVVLGKTYRIDLDSLEEIKAYHLDSGRYHWKWMVQVQGGGLFPVELLDWPTVGRSEGEGFKRCPVCGGSNPGDASHIRCASTGYEGLG